MTPESNPGLIVDVLNIIGEHGVSGIILLLWWLTDRGHQRTLKQYREDMQEHREMYLTNVSLVKKYSKLAEDLRDIVVLNTQKWQEALSAVLQNQYCPEQRKKGSDNE